MSCEGKECVILLKREVEDRGIDGRESKERAAFVQLIYCSVAVDPVAG